MVILRIHIHTVQCRQVEKGCSYWLIRREYPRSALIGRAVPLLDPWDRFQDFIHVQLGSIYTHLS